MSGRISVGTATNNAAILPATEAFDLRSTGLLWIDASPTTTVEAASGVTQFIVTEDIIQTVDQEAIGGGEIDYYCSWFPLSNGSFLQAA